MPTSSVHSRLIASSSDSPSSMPPPGSSGTSGAQASAESMIASSLAATTSANTPRRGLMVERGFELVGYFCQGRFDGTRKPVRQQPVCRRADDADDERVIF